MSNKKKVPEKQGLKKYIFVILKYAFSIILTFLAFHTTDNWRYMIAGFAELGIIVALTDIIAEKKPKWAMVFNDILVLFYNIQMLVLFFGNSFIVAVMLENLSSLEDLAGKALEYGTGTLLVLVCSFLPVKKLPLKHGDSRYLSSLLALELCFTLVWGNGFSPFYGYFNLAAEEIKTERQRRAALSSGENMTEFFYSGGIQDFKVKSEALSVSRPNIILVMAEGLSSNVVTDERQIMPNVQSLMKKSINFTDYYNHTFATYRGISGQLYSGYQDKNLDKNTLISLQDIFGKIGYNTAFINTEPFNTQFTGYLNDLGFDEVIGSTEDECRGLASSISDGDAYDMLFDTAQKKAEDGKPFFIAMYSLGTHASFDSVEEKFGDGSDRMLNKFYDLDCQVGEFVEKFEKSSLFDNTIFVFTADHATYADNDFKKSFPGYERVSVVTDEIPLVIYHKGVEAEDISAEGRNSLDMAPTICDYMDINSENYFLGCTLFSPKQNNNSYDTVFFGDVYFDTDGDKVAELDQSKRTIVEGLIHKYFVAKQQTPVK